MTYCVGICSSQGLVMASDSRTNAGVDNISTVSKMHVFENTQGRVFALLSAGNLATTQEVVDRLLRDLDNQATPNLASCKYLFEAAEYIGQILKGVIATHSETLQQSGVSGDATFIMGGQIQGQKHGLVMIYPQGNYISASEDTPFMQVGETKYGKPVMERIATGDISLEDAARLLLISLDSTARSNLSVGPPYELVIVPADRLAISRRLKYDKKSPELKQIRYFWHDGLRDLFSRIPRFEWEIAQYQGSLPMQEQERSEKNPADIVQEQQQAAQEIFKQDQQPN